MALVSSSLPVACGWEGTGAGGLFTEAELAAADLLVQLSGGGGGGGDEAPSPSSSPRSVNTCAGAAAWEEVTLRVGLRVELDLDLDGRARKRYRLLSELYAATRPVRGAGAGAARKRKRDDEPETPATIARYGDRCY